jgi:Flp pilus assembly protein CpaB
VPLAGFALMLVGLLVVLGYSAAAGKRAPILIAAHNLPAGTLVTPSDLRSSQLGADSPDGGGRRCRGGDRAPM